MLSFLNKIFKKLTINKVLKQQQSVINNFDKVHKCKTCSQTQNKIQLSRKIKTWSSKHQNVWPQQEWGRCLITKRHVILISPEETNILPRRAFNKYFLFLEKFNTDLSSARSPVQATIIWYVSLICESTSIVLLKPQTRFPVSYNHSFIALRIQQPVFKMKTILNPFRRHFRELIRPWCKSSSFLLSVQYEWTEPLFALLRPQA